MGSLCLGTTHLEVVQFEIDGLRRVELLLNSDNFLLDPIIELMELDEFSVIELWILCPVVHVNEALVL